MISSELRDSINALLASQAPRAGPELSTEIERLQRGLIELQAAFEQIHGLLARRPERTEQAQPLIAHLLAERQRLLSQLGERLFLWRLSGGSLTLSPPARGAELGSSSEEPAPHTPRSAIFPDGPSSSDTPPPPLSQLPPSQLPPSQLPPSQFPGSPSQLPPGVAPLSAEALREWQRQLAQPRPPASRPAERALSDERQRALIQALLAQLGDPRDLTNTVAAIDEVDALDAVTQPESVKKWPGLSKILQRAWLALLVARTRALKEQGSLSPGLREKVAQIILRYPAYAKNEQPGYVNGLQVIHSPERGSWHADALYYWAHLRELSQPPPPPSISPPSDSVPPSRRSRSRAPAAPDEDDDEEAAPAIAEDWPLWEQVRGRRAVLIGGEPRETSRVRLESAFEFESLEWMPGDNPRRHESLCERISLEKIDLVLVLQSWIAHKVSNKVIDACKTSGVPWALLGGYGVNAVRQGLERFLGEGAAGA